ncbi:MAG: hypothetical protein M0P72_09705 [Metallibacterium scheffleri]|uniref:hypothetical protein n=1 Tax=Metallibacterium scheffleri TaxID=993689 RepID=UPI0026ECEC47|nr:hypothetical protein [Metallibacterium scheffleri]MCK9367405.1 hypothetical protein [Metallibacterium scheffleri]
MLDTAIGQGAQATAAAAGQATAVGNDANAQDAFSVALGVNSTAGAGVGGQGEVAIGANASAAGNDAIAIGSGADAAAVQSVSIGWGSYAGGTGSIAIGYATAAGADSVALGNGSLAMRADSVSVGFGAIGFLRQVTNMAAGTMPTDAVDLAQLDAGGQATAAWLGGGAAYEAAGTGTYVAPTYVLTSPGAAGTYNNVGSALLALDNGINAANARISSISLTPGPAGPAGPAGATGPQGPQGAGVQPGPGTDTSAVHYDTTSTGTINYASVTLQGKAGTQIHNLAAGTMPTDAANVSQVQQALQTSETFTATSNAQTLTQAMGYTDQQIAGVNNEIGQLGQEIGSLSQRIDGLGAASQAQAQMAMACGSDRNCISAGWGEQGGQGAVALGIRHQVYGGKAAWTAGVASSNAGTSVGVGFAINLGN